MMAAFAPCVVLSFAATSAAGAEGISVAGFSDASPPGPRRVGCYCDLEYEPVCGSNRVTYSSECVLRCVSAERVSSGLPPVRLLYRAKCHAVLIDQIYLNDCYQACDANHANSGLSPNGLRDQDICKPDLCFCPDSIVPVCGTDGKTYSNVCFLQCCSRVSRARGLPALHVHSIGACKNESCDCPRDGNQICTSDGNTYSNECTLDCQNRRRRQLGLEPLVYQYPGECIKCVCTTNVDSICGSDGTTYSNYCLLLCENRARRRQGLFELTVQWRGRCDCGCGQQYAPVCASDRGTWPSQCLLDCENKKRALSAQPRLYFLYDGECRPCYCDYCPTRYSPVCGSDNQTYQSSCFLRCNNNCRVVDGLPPIWEVASRECYR